MGWVQAREGGTGRENRQEDKKIRMRGENPALWTSVDVQNWFYLGVSTIPVVLFLFFQAVWS